MKTDFKIGDQVEMTAHWSCVPLGIKGEVRLVVGSDVGVWWEGWASGHNLVTPCGNQGLPGWFVSESDIRLLEPAEESRQQSERTLLRRKLFIEDVSGIGEQVAHCWDGHFYHHVKEDSNG